MEHKKSESDVLREVQDYYGKVLHTTKDLKTSACCAAAAPEKRIADALSNIPGEVMEKFYGCANDTIPDGDLTGRTVLDLGCGSGRDCYTAAQFVGPTGTVIGIDMTEEQLRVAKGNVNEFAETLGWTPDLRFFAGQIENFPEDAGIRDNSVDLVISNCVVNLSPRKDLVLREAFRVLKPGGEFHFSDVYCDRRLADEVKNHSVLWGECIAGALYLEDFKELAAEVGFKEPRILSKRQFDVNEEFHDVLGDAKFFSVTFRLFKLSSLEKRRENYGQKATYLGSIPERSANFQLDQSFRFDTAEAVPVDGNTATILSESWLSQHFKVEGDKSKHYGLFRSCCAPKPAEQAPVKKCC
jgi:arsenite methyltransferase